MPEMEKYYRESSQLSAFSHQQKNLLPPITPILTNGHEFVFDDTKFVTIR
jgi:hypothetical protein